MKITKSLPDDAFAAYTEVRKYKNIGNYSYIQLGKALLTIKREKLYKAMGHPSYTSFLADPDVAIPRPTAYLYTLLVEFYLEHLKVEEDDIIEIDITRLRDLIPILRTGDETASMVDIWISKAASLSRKDFINEMREFHGRDPMPELDPAEPMEEGGEAIIIADTPYLQIVKASPCCACWKTPVDAHHFPKTTGAGGGDQRVIPLCRECHIKFHSHPKEFFWENKNNIMEWFYRFVFQVCEPEEPAEEAHEDTYLDVDEPTPPVEVNE